MPIKVIDDKGVAHSKCHGVPAETWFDVVRKIRILLSKPEYRQQNGLERLPDPWLVKGFVCVDPDCRRLNRRKETTAAVYRLIRDIEPVLPINHSNEKERRLCQGHPWHEGNTLCQNCAVVAMTKRYLDDERRKAVT